MNTNTGEIREASQVTLEERRTGEWVPLSKRQAEHLATMNRAQRRAWAKEHGTKMPRLDALANRKTP